MESPYLHDDIKYRLYYSQFTEQSLAEPMSDVQQAVLDRQLFEIYLTESTIETVWPSTTDGFTCSDAVRLIEKLTPNLNKGYGWFSEVNPEKVRRLMNGVLAFREQYGAEYGETPSAARIYREYRLQLEQADVANSEAFDDAYEATLLLEVLMGGKIVDGTMPEFASAQH